jgi:2-C-methyl-D-erythritol 2,4-cyclodiphosphate synthase
MDYRIGHSHDTHRLGKNRKLILGGVEIDYPLGLIGHSDADCVYHVISEAVIGALGLGDLGTHFPDHDPKYEGIASEYFVREAKRMLLEHQYQVVNLDLTVYLEKPILSPYIPLMKKNIAGLLEIPENRINLKATRGEGLGYIGRGEGISAECVLLIKPAKPVIQKL